MQTRQELSPTGRVVGLSLRPRAPLEQGATPPRGHDVPGADVHWGELADVKQGVCSAGC